MLNFSLCLLFPQDRIKIKPGLPKRLTGPGIHRQVALANAGPASPNVPRFLPLSTDVAGGQGSISDFPWALACGPGTLPMSFQREVVVQRLEVQASPKGKS